MQQEIFISLSKNQKASLKKTLRVYVRKLFEENDEDIFEKFIEDETYFFEIKNPHFEWIIPFFNDEIFLKDLKNYIKFEREYNKNKLSTREHYDNNKEYLKQQKQQALEYKMRREKPTQKQLYYYNRLCKNHGKIPVETQNLSKLDLKNLISALINEKNKFER